MRSFLIIGLGTFGRHLCEELCKMRCEVVIADKQEEAMEGLLPMAVAAKVCDCTNIDVLRSFDVPSFDACFVCMKSDFQSALEITDQLKELGARKIYAKADRDLEVKFLLRNGADYVVYPDRDAAERIAVNESSERIFDFIELSDECSIFEIVPRDEWVGKTVSDVGLRTRYSLNLIAARRNAGVRPVAGPDYVFKAEEHVFVIGRPEDIRKVT